MQDGDSGSYFGFDDAVYTCLVGMLGEADRNRQILAASEGCEVDLTGTELC